MKNDLKYLGSKVIYYFEKELKKKSQFVKKDLTNKLVN